MFANDFPIWYVAAMKTTWIARKSGSLIGLALLSFVGACKSPDQALFAKAPGEYAGYALVREEKASQELRVEARVERSAESGKAHRWTFLAKSLEAEQSWAIELSVEKFGKISLRGTRPAGDAIELRKSEDGCFSHVREEKKKNDEKKAARVDPHRICFDGDALSIELTGSDRGSLAFVLNRVDSSSQPTLEEPASYRVEELRERARSLSFDSRLEFERVVQSRLRVENAYLNLLPRLTIGDAIGLANPSWSTPIRSVGNLAPFLLPSRWIRANAVKDQYRADRAGWLLMRANSAQSAEGLALMALRDHSALKQIGAYLPELRRIRDLVLDRERLGTSPMGSSDDLTSVIQSVERTVQGLEDLTRAERTGLAGMLGMFNPKAVAEVVPGDELAQIEGVAAVDPTSLRRMTLERSLELRQMDWLIEEAEAEKRARYFDFLDPSGGSNGIGFGLPSYFAISRSRVRELKLAREQVQALLLQKAESVLNDLESSRKNFELARQAYELERRRIDRIMDDFKLGIPVSYAELQVAVLAQLATELDELNARHSYAAARSRMNRLLFIGGYADLHPER